MFASLSPRRMLVPAPTIHHQLVVLVHYNYGIKECKPRASFSIKRLVASKSLFIRRLHLKTSTLCYIMHFYTICQNGTVISP